MNIVTKIKLHNKEVNKEPHSMLIDNRFDNVKDWKKVENNSSILNNNRKPSIEERKKNNHKLRNKKPKTILYKDKLINTATMPKI